MPTPEKRAEYITIRIDSLLLEEVEKVARERRKSRNKILNAAIREWLEEYNLQKEMEAAEAK